MRRTAYIAGIKEGKMRKLSVFAKRPDSKLYHTAISDSLENLQRFVGGPIEVVAITSDVIIICNENGKIDGVSKYNCTILGEQFFGPLIFCGVNGEDFADIPVSFEVFKVVLPQLFEEVQK